MLAVSLQQFNRSTDHKTSIMKTTTTTPTTRKTNRKSSKAAAPVSSTSLDSKKPLPKDVYFRLRYRLALQANNLGSAKKFANILKRMEAPLEVKGETFKTMAKAIEYVDSLKAPKAEAKKVREPKATSDSLAEVLKQINEMATKYNWSKAEVAKMTMAAIDKVGA